MSASFWPPPFESNPSNGVYTGVFAARTPLAPGVLYARTGGWGGCVCAPPSSSSACLIS